MSSDQPGQQRRTFAERLSHLIATVHPPDRGPYSYREIEAGVRGHAGEMTASHIQKLATGQQPHPRQHYIEALAEFFGVPAAYFFDDAMAATIDEELERVLAWGDSPQAQLAQRIWRLPAEKRAAVTSMIEALDAYQAQPARSRPRRRRDSSADGG